MNCMQPDMPCAISRLSRYTSNPNQTNRIPIKRLLGYLKHTQDYTFHYNKYPILIEGYNDTN